MTDALDANVLSMSVGTDAISAENAAGKGGRAAGRKNLFGLVICCSLLPAQREEMGISTAD